VRCRQDCSLVTAAMRQEFSVSLGYRVPADDDAVVGIRRELSQVTIPVGDR
jgi:hypothetical protein